MAEFVIENPQIVNLGGFPPGRERIGTIFDFHSEDWIFQMLYLDGGAETPAEVDAEDIGGIVLLGQGVITLNGADYPVHAGYFFFIPKNVTRRLRSVGGAFQFCVFRPRVVDEE
ncbi:MAG: cupin domain-containing protein [Anaerolineae bacterium]|nr:cupin domain-containing protein [Anaerolineae bacterium]